MSYQLTVKERPSYLHATATGAHTADNALRFFKDVNQICTERHYTSVLLEMNFTGPSLDTGSIFNVISQRSPHGQRFERIAYVDASTERTLDQLKFAETVALNRGVNVRFFRTVADAQRWLNADPNSR